MVAVITVSTEKGGTGKTTLVWGLGGALHDMGRSVLYVDLDGQCSLTYVLKGRTDRQTSYDLLMGTGRPGAAIQPTYQGDLIAAKPELSGIDVKMKGSDRTGRLRTALQDAAKQYDYVLIDTPPALNLATFNGMTASDGLIIPVTADTFAVYGMDGVAAAARDVRAHYNPDLRILGASIGLWDPRTAISRTYLELIEERAAAIPCPVFDTKIRRGVAVPEAQSGCMSLSAWAKKSNQAKDYAALAREIEERLKV